MRFAWWDMARKTPKINLDESVTCNFLMLFVILGAIMIDIFLGWYDNLFLATNEDDQIAIVVFVFGVVGYFLFIAVVDCYLEEYFGKPIGIFFDRELNVLYVKIFQFLLVLSYAIRWFMMYPDDWNPVIYYSPMFFKYSLLCTSGSIFFHLAQVGSSVYVLYKDRNSSKIGANKKDFYGV